MQKGLIELRLHVVSDVGSTWFSVVN